MLVLGATYVVNKFKCKVKYRAHVCQCERKNFFFYMLFLIFDTSCVIICMSVNVEYPIRGSGISLASFNTKYNTKRMLVLINTQHNDTHPKYACHKMLHCDTKNIILLIFWVSLCSVLLWWMSLFFVSFC